MNTKRCQAEIQKRDTYRYTGRGRTGFTMHYASCQCARVAKKGDFCAQHSNNRSLRVKYGREFIDATA